MAKIPKQGGEHNSDWSHREMRGWSRARGGDPHAKGGGQKKSWFSCGVVALAGLSAAAVVLTEVVANII